MQPTSVEARPGIRSSPGADESRPVDGLPKRRLSRRWEVIGAIAAAVGALAAAAWSLELWHINWGVPLAYGSDAMFSEATVKSVISGGWIWHINGLGAPFGTQLYDFPLGTDDLNFLVVKVLGITSSNPGLVDNLFFLYTFVAEAISAFFVLRWLRISKATSIVCAILFADAPYHLFRGEIHLMLSSYASVPIIAYLILSVLDGSSVFVRRPGVAGGGRVKRWVKPLLSWRNLFTIALCIVIASTGLYYAIFGVCVLSAAGVAAAVGRRSWRPVAQAVLVIVAIGAVLAINDLPSLIYEHEHGRNALAADRLPQESEIYALKLVEMVLPVPGHRITALRHIRYTYDTTNPVPSEDAEESLGIVASLGLAWLFVLALTLVAGIGREAAWLRRHRQLAFAAVGSFVLGTLGGVSALIGYLVTPEVRGWDRISILIAFFSIAAVGLGLDALRRRLAGRRGYWAFPVLGAVLVIGIYDQSSVYAVPPYAANHAQYSSDSQFVARIQRMLPKGAEIYQMPYMVFPENGPVNRMLDYDLARGYIYSSDLRWSYGAMKGRPQDWAGQDQGLPLPTLIDGIVSAGFSGIWVDRYGYADNGASIKRTLQGILHTAPIQSPDGRMLFFDLRPFAARLRAKYPPDELTELGRATIYPVPVVWQGGFYDNEYGSRWATSNSIASVDNTSKVPIRMVFSSSVFSAEPGHWSLTVIAPGAPIHKYVITQKAKPILISFNDPPGLHHIIFESNAPLAHPEGDPRALGIRYDNLVAANAGFTPFLP